MLLYTLVCEKGIRLPFINSSNSSYYVCFLPENPRKTLFSKVYFQQHEFCGQSKAPVSLYVYFWSQTIINCLDTWRKTGWCASGSCATWQYRVTFHNTFYLYTCVWWLCGFIGHRAFQDGCQLLCWLRVPMFIYFLFL